MQVVVLLNSTAYISFYNESIAQITLLGPKDELAYFNCVGITVNNKCLKLG